ncbi:hypothetical protein [Saccharopolyspora phatthalungensis]|uniref:Uncharacterized protein n=1 Tax=Saccharopolyspora phatthalungensis TaxID=664693 RepID=A0A840Q381_9PSEU|nr:hypothetical protein [Saccharopolyspora phatthalungensis]MBB5154954.1 hypothetical protein [Saccharopolyspora phatthalungensis]
MGRKYKFNRYVREARSEPFDLELDDGQEISIPAPDGDTVLEIEESRSSRRTLELLTGDYFDQVYELVRHEPASVLNGLVADMADHFGLAAAPPGGTRASSR